MVRTVWALVQGTRRLYLVDDACTFLEPVKRYLEALDIQGKSPNTLESYCRHLKHYFTFLEEAHLDWRAVTPDDLLRFVEWLRNPYRQLQVHPLHLTSRLSERSINTILAAVANFYRYHVQRGQVFHFRPHEFRHTVGTDMIIHGMGLADVMTYLDHQSAEMTHNYTQIYHAKAPKCPYGQNVCFTKDNGPCHKLVTTPEHAPVIAATLEDLRKSKQIAEEKSWELYANDLSDQIRGMEQVLAELALPADERPKNRGGRKATNEAQH